MTGGMGNWPRTVNKIADDLEGMAWTADALTAGLLERLGTQFTWRPYGSMVYIPDPLRRLQNPEQLDIGQVTCWTARITVKADETPSIFIGEVSIAFQAANLRSATTGDAVRLVVTDPGIVTAPGKVPAGDYILSARSFARPPVDAWRLDDPAYHLDDNTKLVI